MLECDGCIPGSNPTAKVIFLLKFCHMQISLNSRMSMQTILSLMNNECKKLLPKSLFKSFEFDVLACKRKFSITDGTKFFKCACIWFDSSPLRYLLLNFGNQAFWCL